MRELSKHFLAARIKSGLYQKQLAEITGIQQCTISRFEQGRQDITLDTAKKLSLALKNESLNKEIRDYLVNMFS